VPGKVVAQLMGHAKSVAACGSFGLSQV
jgi:hypothetical protein